MGGVPTVGVSAVLLNVTAIDPTDDGFLTAYPKLPRGVVNPADPIRVFDDQSSFLPNYPNSSNLNFVAGDIVPNLVLARVGAGGKIRLKNFDGLTNAAADIVGWFDTGAKRATASPASRRPACSTPATARAASAAASRAARAAT